MQNIHTHPQSWQLCQEQGNAMILHRVPRFHGVFPRRKHSCWRHIVVARSYERQGRVCKRVVANSAEAYEMIK